MFNADYLEEMVPAGVKLFILPDAAMWLDLDPFNPWVHLHPLRPLPPTSTVPPSAMDPMHAHDAEHRADQTHLGPKRGLDKPRAQNMNPICLGGGEGKVWGGQESLGGPEGQRGLAASARHARWREGGGGWVGGASFPLGSGGAGTGGSFCSPGGHVAPYGECIKSIRRSLRRPVSAQPGTSLFIRSARYVLLALAAPQLIRLTHCHDPLPSNPLMASVSYTLGPLAISCPVKVQHTCVCVRARACVCV